MSWVPTAGADREAMLAAIGVDTIQDLFDTIPGGLRAQSWNLPQGRSEMAVRDMMGTMAARNAVCHTRFLKQCRGGMPEAVEG